MVLLVLRGLFIFLVASVAMLYLLTHQEDVGFGVLHYALFVAIATTVAALVVLADVKTRQKRLAAVSGVFLGMIAGLLAAYALSFVVDLLGLLTLPEMEADRQAHLAMLDGVKVIVGLITCYLGISLVLQTKDDFRFVIPYVEFAKQIRGSRPVLLDTSVIVDGRILDIAQTGVIQGTLVIPKFVLEELQGIADSGDKLRRARGRRGLDVLRQLQDSPNVEVVIDESEAEGPSVDQKLIARAEAMQGRVMTNDYNLNKVAGLRGVEVVNLNDLAKAMRPVVLPGETMQVRIIKPGESADQGVGYLEDGTMIVVEHGREHIGEQVQILVTSTLQTSAGRMIFGKCEQGGHAEPAGAAAGAGGEHGQEEHSTRGARSRGRVGRNPRRGGRGEG